MSHFLAKTSHKLYVFRTLLTRNSAIANKPRDAFVQMQWRGSPPKSTPVSMC